MIIFLYSFNFGKQRMTREANNKVPFLPPKWCVSRTKAEHVIADNIALRVWAVISKEIPVNVESRDIKKG